MNNPDIARLLLDHGANPNDRSSLTQAVQQRDHACLRLLLAYGATIPGSWALGAVINADDAEAVRLLLEAAGKTETAERVADVASRGLPDAATTASVAVVETLLAVGADPNGSFPEESPLRRAARYGRFEVVDLLSGRGVTGDLTSIDRLLGACARADRADGGRLLADEPGLLNQLSDTDRAAIVEAAGRPDPAAVCLMLDLGFSPQARNELGETALHTAAYEGRVRTVQLLLDHGAEIDSLDARFISTPLAYATVGSGEHVEAGDQIDNLVHDWVATVRTLLDAGASHQDVWISGKPPSDQVVAVLRSHGITADNARDDTDFAPPSGSSDAGEPPEPELETLSEIAETIQVAYESVDLELFASLLHPEVRWADWRVAPTGPRCSIGTAAFSTWACGVVSPTSCSVVTAS